MSNEFSYGYTYDVSCDNGSFGSKLTYSDYYQHIYKNIEKITVTTSINAKGKDTENKETKGKED